MEENKKSNKDLEKSTGAKESTESTLESVSNESNTEQDNSSLKIVTENDEDKTTEAMDNGKDSEKETRYETLVQLDENLWTYGSPIIFESGVLERDKVSNKNRLTLAFTNLDSRIIKNVDITVIVENGEENQEEIGHQYVALGQKYLSSKGKNARIDIKNEMARKFEIKVNRVEFEDGSLWSKDDSIYESTGEIDNIEAFAEAKAKDYEDNYISGTGETDKDDSVSIGNGIEILKRIVWYKNTSEILVAAKKKYKISKLNEERKQAGEERRLKRKQAVKKRYTIAGISICVAVLLVTISIVAFFIPNNKYKDAKKYIKQQKYEQAVKAFSKLNGFLNSESYLAQSYYNLGLKELESANEKKASDYFTKGHDADKDSDYGKMAGAFLDYYAGQKALESKDYDKAGKLFKSSSDAASDFNLINKAGAGMAQIYYLKQQYQQAWNTIKNVYAKDTSYQKQYGEYGYGYAKSLVDSGKTKEGMEIYNNVSKFTQSTNLNESVYNQAVKLAEQGKIDEAVKLLDTIRKNYNKAEKLHANIKKFNNKVQYWVGVWTHKAKVNGEKKTYKITISKVLYKNEMCLKITDLNNKYLGFDTVISNKNRVTQIVIGSYQLHFKLKKFHDQKFTYTLQEGSKMIRELKYDGSKYKTKYKKK